MKTGVICLLFGYLIGTVNPAYMMSKLRGFDIREEGSGNAGASNVVLICDYICVVALSASVLFPLVYVWQTGDWIGYAGLLAVSVVMFYKHKENIMRIMEGKEVRVSYLWNKEKEKERLHEFYDV